MNISIRRNYFSTHVVTRRDLIRTAAPLTLLLMSARLVISSSLPLGTMLALLSLSASFLTSLESLINTGQQLQQAYAHLERIDDIMSAEPEQPQRQAAHPPKLTGNLRLVDGSFQYIPNYEPVLHDINVTIAPGQKVAIVGYSGAGKTVAQSLPSNTGRNLLR